MVMGQAATPCLVPMLVVHWLTLPCAALCAICLCLVQVRSIGPNVLLMSPDTRSERTINQVPLSTLSATQQTQLLLSILGDCRCNGT
jgi:hypothetical protein